MLNGYSKIILARARKPPHKPHILKKREVKEHEAHDLCKGFFHNNKRADKYND